jgi:hypothetical protein
MDLKKLDADSEQAQQTRLTTAPNFFRSISIFFCYTQKENYLRLKNRLLCHLDGFGRFLDG